MKKFSYPIPHGTDRMEIEVDAESNNWCVKFIPKDVAYFFCERTGADEKSARVGDIAIVWDDGAINSATISYIVDWNIEDEGVRYITNEGRAFDNAIKFRDMQQCLSIIGIK